MEMEQKEQEQNLPVSSTHIPSKIHLIHNYSCYENILEIKSLYIPDVL